MHLRRMDQLEYILYQFDHGKWEPDTEFAVFAPETYNIQHWTTGRKIGWDEDIAEIGKQPYIIEGCALGIAIMTKSFNDQGLKYNPLHAMPMYNCRLGYGGIADFFNIPFHTAVYLFHPGSYILPAENQLWFVRNRLADLIKKERAKWHRNWSITKRIHEWLEND